MNKKQLELGILEIAEKSGLKYIYSTSRFIKGFRHDNDLTGVELVSTRLGLFEDVGMDTISIKEYKERLNV